MPYVASFLIIIPAQLIGADAIKVDEWLINSPLARFIYVFLTSALTAAALYWFISYKKVSLRRAIGLDKPRWAYLLHTILGFVAYFMLFIVILSVLRIFVPIDLDQDQALPFEKGTSGSGLVLAFIGLVIIPPIIEESVFRGFAYGALRSSRINAVVSSLVVGATFAYLHLNGGAGGSTIWIAFVDTFILSLVLCYVREKTGSIWACIGIHALKNGFVFVNLFLLGTA
ncbi:MAG TPA: type II CAAX endopeptidase family protein [Candidatus Saccharimonadales bacterium]|nr:type II CAAX endopeptidase family protein [Candidatus Saccharimonadales bacterium]